MYEYDEARFSVWEDVHGNEDEDDPLGNVTVLVCLALVGAAAVAAGAVVNVALDRLYDRVFGEA